MARQDVGRSKRSKAGNWKVLLLEQQDCGTTQCWQEPNPRVGTESTRASFSEACSGLSWGLGYTLHWAFARAFHGAG